MNIAKAAAALTVRTPEPHEIAELDAQLAAEHCLGAGRPVGDYRASLSNATAKTVALLVWAPACCALKDRDRWFGWGAVQRVERLKLIVQNRRFLVLTAKGQSPNLAPQAMGAALRALRLPQEVRAALPPPACGRPARQPGAGGCPDPPHGWRNRNYPPSAHPAKICFQSVLQGRVCP